MPVEALLLPLRMPLFCSFEIIALVGCGIRRSLLLYSSQKKAAPGAAGDCFSVIHIVENSLAGLGQPQLVAGQVLDELLVILLG